MRNEAPRTMNRINSLRDHLAKELDRIGRKAQTDWQSFADRQRERRNAEIAQAITAELKTTWTQEGADQTK